MKKFKDIQDAYTAHHKKEGAATRKLEEYFDMFREAMAVTDEDKERVKRIEALIKEVEELLGPEIIAEGISRMEMADKGN
jgi:hypothetical protein